MLQVFDGLLRASPESKKALLTWLVSCLDWNKNRGKMASQSLVYRQTQASDGFFLNLSWVMLRLCSPFLISEKNDSTRRTRIRTIDVSYTNCDKGKVMSIDGGGPLVGYCEDARLVPLRSGWCDSVGVTVLV